MNIKDRLKKVKLSDIHPYANNAKIHSPKQIKDLIKSIKEYDYNVPISLGKDNVIISGHGRYYALKEMNPEQKIEILDLSHLTKEQECKYRILENKIISEEWDKDMLQKEIDDIYGGFDDLDKIADELSFDDIEKYIPEVDTESDDEIPENVKTTTKLGDLWELGKHRLLWIFALLAGDLK